MTIPNKPAIRPGNPRFSSGPCAKRPGWDVSVLRGAALGRSHRSKHGKAKLAEAIERTHALLDLPDTHRVAIVPASDTGAVELAMWALLGERPVDVLAWESFGQDWVKDARDEVKLRDVRVDTAGYGEIVDLNAVRREADVIFTWNGTTSGVRVPHGDWIDPDRDGLMICDATSAAFAQSIAWDKIDVGTFSWQKALGGEGGFGMLVLSPKAIARFEEAAPRALPKLFRVTKGGAFDTALFEGSTINTPSLLAVEDWLDALKWGGQIGGLQALQARADTNLAALARWINKTPSFAFLVEDPAIRSNTSVTIRFADSRVTGLSESDQRSLVKSMTGLLEAEEAAFDIAGYRKAPPGLRVWCGATVQAEDIEALGPWLDWALETALSDVAKAA
jgi:phosphoserine aminotransferase